jgi:hypothetical protein
MKTRFGRKILLLGVAVFIFGCATGPDWNMRVGHYTYDQAVAELGPPDKQAKLSSGELVAEWVTRYSTGGSTVVGPGVYPYGGYVTTVGPRYYEDTLRLTFETNRVLTGWVKK